MMLDTANIRGNNMLLCLLVSACVIALYYAVITACVDTCTEYGELIDSTHVYHVEFC